jgi:hypothetical protein
LFADQSGNHLRVFTHNARRFLTKIHRRKFQLRPSANLGENRPHKTILGTGAPRHWSIKPRSPIANPSEMGQPNLHATLATAASAKREFSVGAV